MKKAFLFCLVAFAATLTAFAQPDKKNPPKDEFEEFRNMGKPAATKGKKDDLDEFRNMDKKPVKQDPPRNSGNSSSSSSTPPAEAAPKPATTAPAANGEEDEFAEFRNMENTIELPDLPQEGNGEVTVNEIIEMLPADLLTTELLLPYYEEVDVSKIEDPAQRKAIETYNKQVASRNKEYKNVVLSNYKAPKSLVICSEYTEYFKRGHKYALDFVFMPKKLNYPNRQALVPFFLRVNNLGLAFNNRNTQFYIYYFIRDLQTDNIYIGRHFRGYKEVYGGMMSFFKAIQEEAKYRKIEE